MNCQTDRRPQECKHYKGSVCARSKRCYRPCILKCGVHCPDFTSKPRKMENNQISSECKHEFYGDCMIHTGDYGGADYCKLCEDYHCPDYQLKEKKDNENN